MAVINENGLWIRDEINQNINIINANKVDDAFLLDVFIAQFDKNFNIIRTIESEKINISSFNWEITNPKILENNTISISDKIELISNFDYEKINGLFSNLSIFRHFL